MKAIIYLRISTFKQQDGYGLEIQEKACRLYINQLEPEEILIFKDIISGTTPIAKRLGLLNALLSLKPRDYFIVYNRSRIGRDVSIAFIVERIIKKADAILICVQETELGSTSISSIIMNHIADVLAQRKSLEISKSVKKNIKQKRKTSKAKFLPAVPTNPPFGFKYCNGKIEECSYEIQIVKLIRKLHDKGFSLREIVKNINECGYRNRKNNPFQLTQVVRIIQRK